MDITSALSSSSTVTTVDADMTFTSEDFYELLIAEVTNQDPLEPMSNQELTLQMMQLQNTESLNSVCESLEELIDETSSYTDMLSSLVTSSSLNSVTSMIGRNVSYADESSGEETTSEVKGVTIKDGVTYFVLEDGSQVELGDITTIS